MKLTWRRDSAGAYQSDLDNGTTAHIGRSAVTGWWQPVVLRDRQLLRSWPRFRRLVDAKEVVEHYADGLVRA